MPGAGPTTRSWPDAVCGPQAGEPGPAGEQLCAPFPISFDGSARAVQAGPIRLFAGVQMDRGGNPTINPFINPDGEKNRYNSRQPADDVANYLGPWSKLLEGSGYPPDEARASAMQVLPDILQYDQTKPAHYPNGRGLTDDVFSMRFAWLTHGKVPPTGLRPHDDLRADFPYLGVPNPI